MSRITAITTALSLSQFAFGGIIPSQDQKTEPNLMPSLGQELANATVTLKTGKILPFFASLSMITDSPLSEHPLVRMRLLDPSNGKEKFKIISIEESSSQKSKEVQFIDRSDPKRKIVIGKAFDDKTFLKAFNDRPELFFKDQVLGKFITQEAILLHGYKAEDMNKLYESPIKLSLMPSNTQDNTNLASYEVDPNPIKDSVSFTFEFPNIANQEEEIKYRISMGKLLSETFAIFSRVVMTNETLDPDNSNIMTTFHLVNSDVKAVISYFGEDKDTKNKSYHILLERDGDFKPISSTQIIEESNGKLTVILHDGNTGKRFDAYLGEIKNALDFAKLSESYNGTNDLKLIEAEKKLFNYIMKPFNSNLKANLEIPTSALLTDYKDLSTDSLITIHQEAITYAQNRAKTGATLFQVIPDILTGLNLPWRMNPSRRYIYLRNPENPRKLEAN